MALIELKDVCKEFTQDDLVIRALNNINLSIEENDIYGIIGMSGAGKSTLVRCLNYLEKPTSGTVIIDGEKLGALTERELREKRGSIAMIFQHFNLLMQKTVIDNVMFPLKLKGIKKAEAKAKALEYLKTVGLEDKAKAYPAQLSGGQKQRVAIARALATDPKVLLCDEATSALDPKTTRAILELLKKINKELGITLVVITHEMDVIKQVCNKVAIIEKGEIVEKGNVQDVFTKPKSQAARKLFFPDEREKKTEHRATTKHRVRLVYDTQNAYEPIISNMILELKAPINILYANMDVVNDIQKGQMVICLADDAQMAERQKQYLRDQKVEFIEIEEEGEDE